MNDEQRNDLLPTSTTAETLIDVVAAASTLVPWLGGPLGNVISGISLNRKIERVNEVVMRLANMISDLKSESAEQYVKTEDFQDLLEKTLKTAAEERNENKRRAFANFLANDIRSPHATFDEKERILRTLQELQWDHIRLLKALMQSPDPSRADGFMGSIGQTLRHRLSDLSEDQITLLTRQLTSMQLTNLTELNVTMTAHGAEDLQRRVTAFGRKVISYIVGS